MALVAVGDEVRIPQWEDCCNNSFPNNYCSTRPRQQHSHCYCPPSFSCVCREMHQKCVSIFRLDPRLECAASFGNRGPAIGSKLVRRGQSRDTHDR